MIWRRLGRPVAARERSPPHLDPVEAIPDLMELPTVPAPVVGTPCLALESPALISGPIEHDADQIVRRPGSVSWSARHVTLTAAPVALDSRPHAQIVCVYDKRHSISLPYSAAHTSSGAVPARTRAHADPATSCFSSTSCRTRSPLT